MIKLTDLLREEIVQDKAFEEFADKRMDGAEKIADNAHDKGGISMLTYHHFRVKLPYYKKAKEGKLDIDEAKKEYQKRLDICLGCDRLIKSTKQCKECGCFMNIKTQLPHASCPLGKWD